MTVTKGVSASRAAGTTRAYPLRERRKQRTRATLIDAASELFFTQGYEETTLDEIAEKAGVHVQTLYRHFPNKEALALAPDRATFDRLAELLRAPDRQVGAIDLWRRYVEQRATEALARSRDLYLRRIRSHATVPSLTVASLQLWREYEDLLTEALARDAGIDPDQDRRPRLIACMLWGGHQHAMRKWIASKGKLDLITEALACIDDVRALADRLGLAEPAPPARRPASRRTSGVSSPRGKSKRR